MLDRPGASEDDPEKRGCTYGKSRRAQPSNCSMPTLDPSFFLEESPSLLHWLESDKSFGGIPLARATDQGDSVQKHLNTLFESCCSSFLQKVFNGSVKSIRSEPSRKCHQLIDKLVHLFQPLVRPQLGGNLG